MFQVNWRGDGENHFLNDNHINHFLVDLLILPSIWHRFSGIAVRKSVRNSSIFIFLFSARHNILPNKSLSILTSTKLPLPHLATYFIHSFANVKTFCLDNIFNQSMIFITSI